MKRDENLDSYVIIEAISSGVANMIAESIGIYFNGWNSGIDCDRYGDRLSTMNIPTTKLYEED